MQRVDMYMITNQKYFAPDKLMYIRERLLAMDEYRFSMLPAVELKEPTTILVVSLLVGSLGIDRFMIGDTGMGILKLLTVGCCGVLTIVDWFLIQDRTKEQNFQRLMMYL